MLLVEDDESLRRIVDPPPARPGFQVAEAASAEDAVEALERGVRPRLVLLDLNLPGDTGWDLLRGPAFDAAGRPPSCITSATTVSPKRLAEFRVAGTCPSPSRSRPCVATVDRFVDRTENQASNQ